MSLGYHEHVRTRYLLTHEEIFDYRKAKSRLDADVEETRRQNFVDLERRQRERRRMLDLLIEASQQSKTVLGGDPYLAQELKEAAEDRRRELDEKWQREERRHQADEFSRHIGTRRRWRTSLLDRSQERIREREQQYAMAELERQQQKKERERRIALRQMEQEKKRAEEAEKEKEKKSKEAAAAPSRRSYTRSTVTDSDSASTSSSRASARSTSRYTSSSSSSRASRVGADSIQSSSSSSRLSSRALATAAPAVIEAASEPTPSESSASDAKLPADIEPANLVDKGS